MRRGNRRTCLRRCSTFSSSLSVFTATRYPACAMILRTGMMPIYNTWYIILKRPFYAYRQKSLFIAGGVQARVFSSIVGGESCTLPVSTNSASADAGEPRLTRGTCFVASRFELATVAVLLRLCWLCLCCLCSLSFERRDFVFFFVFS